MSDTWAWAKGMTRCAHNEATHNTATHNNPHDTCHPADPHKAHATTLLLAAPKGSFGTAHDAIGSSGALPAFAMRLMGAPGHVRCCC